MKVLLSSGSKVRFPLIEKVFILMFLLLAVLPNQVFAQNIECNSGLDMQIAGEPFYEGDTVTVDFQIMAGVIDGGDENTLTVDTFHFGPDCSPSDSTSCTTQGNTITYVTGSASTTDCFDGTNPAAIEFDVTVGAILDFSPKTGWGPVVLSSESSCTVTFDLTIDNFVSPPGHSYLVFEPGGWSNNEARCDNFLDTSAFSSVGFTVNEPDISIQKYTNGEDADVPEGPQILVGDPVAWTYVVTNTGNIPLIDVSVDDDQGVAVTCPEDTLLPDVSTTMTCTAIGVAQAGQYTNIGTVSGIPTNIGPNFGDPVGPAVTANDPSNYFGLNPDFMIEKSSPQYPGPLEEPGTISYSYMVTNTGNVDLTSLALVDTNTASAPVCGKTMLVVGDFTTCSATHEFTQEELDAGGNDACGLYNYVTANTDQVGPRDDELCIPVLFMVPAVPTNSNLGLQVMAALLLLTGLIVRRIS